MKYPMNFIAAGHEYTDVTNWATEIKPVPAPYFRKKISLDIPPEKASFIITATGFYELFVNGKRITKSRLSPYISNPDDLLVYDSYDICHLLNKGENVLGVWLGNGFGNNPGGWVWQFDKARFRQAPAFAALLNLGDSEIETGVDFKTAPSPLIFDDYRGGEYYDARKEINEWSKASFDDTDWANAVLSSLPRGQAITNIAQPILVADEIKPVSIKKVENGYVFDFGINTAGVCRLKVKGTYGQKIILNYGEYLNDDQSLNVSNINYNVGDFIQKDIFICSGGQDEWEPVFTYHGFRYVSVQGITDDQAVEGLLTYIVMNTSLSERGGFHCSDNTLNTLQELTRRSTLSNFHHILTDCPHRERNGWTADTALSAEHILLNLAPDNNFRQWLHSVRKAQADNGSLPGIVPTAGWGFTFGNGPAWDCVLVYLPYFLYVYRGNRDVLEENAHAILRYLEYISTQTDEDGLIAIGLGDWCPPGRECDDYKSPLRLTDTLISMDICNKASFIFNVLKKPFHSEFACSLSKQFYSAAREKLIDFSTMTAAGDCQTSQAMAIFYNLFTQQEKSAAFARLLEIIQRDNNVLDTGVLGARVIFHVLAEFGHAELALKMIIGPGFPSYGWWIEQGATSLWEEFRTDRKMSLNHHFWGDISHWFIRWLAGIHYNPRCIGGEADICPQFVPQLSFAEGFHIAPEGEIRVRWEHMEVGIILNISVPESLKGNIVLPTGYKFDDGGQIKPLVSGGFAIYNC